MPYPGQQPSHSGQLQSQQSCMAYGSHPNSNRSAATGPPYHSQGPPPSFHMQHSHPYNVAPPSHHHGGPPIRHSVMPPRAMSSSAAKNGGMPHHTQPSPYSHHPVPNFDHGPSSPPYHHLHHRAPPPEGIVYLASAQPANYSAPGCTCKKSKCLKLYCQCFAAAKLCNLNLCKCSDCLNHDFENAERAKAVRSILDRKPNAFEDKINQQESQVTTNLAPPHVYHRPPPPIYAGQDYHEQRQAWPPQGPSPSFEDHYHHHGPPPSNYAPPMHPQHGDYRGLPLGNPYHHRHSPPHHTPLPPSIHHAQPQDLVVSNTAPRPDERSYSSSSPQNNGNTVASSPDASSQKGGNASVSHRAGCKCRKSACLKKYCECFNGGIKCGDSCRCNNCKNQPPPPTPPPPRLEEYIPRSLLPPSPSSIAQRKLDMDEPQSNPKIGNADDDSLSKDDDDSLDSSEERQDAVASLNPLSKTPAALLSEVEEHQVRSQIGPNHFSSNHADLTEDKVAFLAAIAMTELWGARVSPSATLSTAPSPDYNSTITTASSSSVIAHEDDESMSRYHEISSTNNFYGESSSSSSTAREDIVTSSRSTLSPSASLKRKSEVLDVNAGGIPLNSEIIEDTSGVNPYLHESSSFVSQSLSGKHMSKSARSWSSDSRAGIPHESSFPNNMRASPAQGTVTLQERPRFNSSDDGFQRSNNFSRMRSSPCHEVATIMHEGSRFEYNQDEFRHSNNSSAIGSGSGFLPICCSMCRNSREPLYHAKEGSSTAPKALFCSRCIVQLEDSACNALSNNVSNAPKMKKKGAVALSDPVEALPKSLTYRKICSTCGKTRGEHGELGFGNKCVFQDCGRCGAGLQMHLKAKSPMGFLCKLSVHNGAIPGAIESYEEKIKGLASEADLRRTVSKSGAEQMIAC